MADIKAFRALRFDCQKAGDIAELTCPPYDIISEQQRLEYIEKNEHNVIRLELPREGEDPYAQAGRLEQQWEEEGTVSYTHLDVYKRQRLGYAAAPPPDRQC